MRSNMFANMENQFEFCSTEEIKMKTLQNLGDLADQLDGKMNLETMFGILICAARLGVASKSRILNSEEKSLVDTVFEIIWNGDMQMVYDMVTAEIDEDTYRMVEMVVQLGNGVALPFLNMILGFAYIDGKVNDQVMAKLDGLFGICLLTMFFQSGLEEVPTPMTRKPELVGLEADIAAWFRADNADNLVPLKDIVAHFPGKTKAEVKKACDSLRDKGILWGGDNLIHCMYGLEKE